MAYSTRSLEPATVTNSRSYWLAVMISSIIWPSCNSPRIPRVLVLERTLFSVPTSRATLCISPRPRLTDSNCLETVSKEVWRRVWSVFSSFSSTVCRICSRRVSLDSWICRIRSSVLSRFLVRLSLISKRSSVKLRCKSVLTSLKRSPRANSSSFWAVCFFWLSCSKR